ncbi:hypothetical protein MAM1_0053d03458 [Mucor ambiguus]|uniref:Uncharacterized protein n=1 Tax=Mucor ambiguus TaxID=91626 RepID=A0A0C9MLJ2_9FUNG|nr:hypothetical protein MAM1_0053d03458 [Mucor ambiguus]
MNEHRDLRVYRSSNKIIALEEIKRVRMINVDTIINKQCGISVKNLFQKYFQIQTQNREQQAKDDESSEASIIHFMEELRQDLIQDSRTVFDESQLLFCLPLEWTEEEPKQALRTLFLASGWITKQDQEHRLIFSQHIERLVNYLQERDDTNKQFERERRYLFCYINERAFKLTCFQMQSAKELSSVSKKLAASDFLLTPTFLDEESISLLNFDMMIYTKDKEGRSSDRIDVVLSAHSSFFEYQYVRDRLNGWTCGTFINEVFNDADIKLFLQQIIQTCQSILEKYGPIKNSPEGIQDIILYADCKSSNPFHRDLVRDILLKKDIIEQENDFMDVCNDLRLCEGAIQRPCKMIQIANALLPPIIWNDDAQHETEPKLHIRQELDIIPSNSFYLQCYIHQHYINFILNKVVTVSVVDDIERKSTFTVQEDTINTRDLLDLACDLIWEHYQELDLHHGGDIFTYCDAHTHDLLSISHYCIFKSNLSRLVNIWLKGNPNLNDGATIDTYKTLFISDNCQCSVNVSQRILLEVGLKPAIDNLAAVVVSTLASDHLFGLYNIAALIITDKMNLFKEVLYFDHYTRIMLQKSIRSYLQVHRKKPVVFFDEATLMACSTLGAWSESARQILGRGNYTQISGANYGIRLFAKKATRQGSFNGLYEYYDHAYRKNKVIDVFPNLIVLSKGDRLGQEGVSKTLVLHNYDVRRIGKFGFLILNQYTHSIM